MINQFQRKKYLRKHQNEVKYCICNSSWNFNISNLTCASKEDQNDEIDEDIENDENKIQANFDDSSDDESNEFPYDYFTYKMVQYKTRKKKR